MYSAVFLPGRMPGMYAAVLLEVVGHVHRVEGHRRVEVGEEDDEHDVEGVVDPAARAASGRRSAAGTGTRTPAWPGRAAPSWRRWAG